jgi:hypothetical protein
MTDEGRVDETKADVEGRENDHSGSSIRWTSVANIHSCLGWMVSQRLLAVVDAVRKVHCGDSESSDLVNRFKR